MHPECDVQNLSLDEAGALEQLPSTFDQIAIVGVMPVILCLGVTGNLTFLLMLYRVPKMRSFTNFYLANLAVSDIVFLLFGISSKIHQHRTSGVNFSVVYGGAFSCLLKYFVVDMSYFASLFMITLVSVEKFYAICKPMRHRLVVGWRRTVRFAVGSWIISLIFASAVIPSYAHVQSLCIVWPPGDPFKDIPGHYWRCTEAAPWAGDFTNIFQTVPFFTTFVLNTAMYALIVQRLSQRAEQPLGLQNHAHFPNNAQRTRNQAAKMLVINGMVFFVLLAPFEVASLLLTTEVLAPWNKRQLALQICRLLSYLNSAVNPFIYGAVNLRYRHAYKLAFVPRHRNRIDAIEHALKRGPEH